MIRGFAPAFTQQKPTYTTGPIPDNLSANSLAATVVPGDFAVTATVQSAVAQKITNNPIASHLGAAVTYRQGCDPKDSSFDYRTTGAVQPPKDQTPCGACYIFAATAACEASWYLQNKEQIRLSEQQVLDCASAGGCTGGFHPAVFDFAKQHGFIREDQYKPYHANAAKCDVPNGPYTAVNWDTVYRKAGTPNVAAIKEALCVHGPVAAAMFSTDSFVRYKSGVFNEFPDLDGDSDINHDILIIGWDDKKDAWLIKNSWGPNWWGDKGFGWIRYRTNNIGFGAAWVDAVKVTKTSANPEADLRASAIQSKAVTAQAIEEIRRNPDQILGGANSVIRNPGQLLGGPNSAVNKILRGRF
jgi:cathepsin L